MLFFFCFVESGIPSAQDGLEPATQAEDSLPADPPPTS